MSHPALPCNGCGGKKSPISGARYCDTCRDQKRAIWMRESTRKKEQRLKAARHEAQLKGGKVTSAWHAGIAPEGTKWCARCQQFLPLDEFGRHPGRVRASATYCRECYSVYAYELRLKKTYGITLEQYEALLAHQDGRCAVCYGKPRKRRLAVDHNHKTGEIRGLLCTRCNHKMIGAAHENPVILRRAAEYLESPPARTMEPIGALGDWDEVRMDALFTEAEEVGEEPVVLMDVGEEPCAVMPLSIFAALLKEATS